MKPKHLRQWVCWRSEERDGRLTKVSYSPGTGLRARSDDLTTWGTYNGAREAARHGDYDGVGFVFTERDPFCGVDLDGCVDSETGEVSSWAAEVLDELDSYTELSPSGRGLHFLVRAVLPSGGRRRGRVEMYDRGRFFTVTGRHLPGTPRGIEERQNRITALHVRLFPARERPAANGSAPANTLDDAEVLRRARSAANGERFAGGSATQPRPANLPPRSRTLPRWIAASRATPPSRPSSQSWKTTRVACSSTATSSPGG